MCRMTYFSIRAEKAIPSRPIEPKSYVVVNRRPQDKELYLVHVPRGEEKVMHGLYRINVTPKYDRKRYKAAALFGQTLTR